MTVENFVRIVWTLFVFEKIEKSPKMSVFGHFRANFGFLTPRPYNFDAIAHTGAPLGVE